jgi:hypothetical protein
MPRIGVYGFSATLWILVAWPAFRSPPKDSFPLSDYPMFSHTRPERMEITHALGVLTTGSRIPLSPSVTAGTWEVLQSMAVIRDATFGGPVRRGAFCNAVADRVRDDPDLNGVIAVELATSTYDTIRYFEEGAQPVRRIVHHRCPATPPRSSP